jgi:iron complex transport system ATP-binding protein
MTAGEIRVQALLYGYDKPLFEQLNFHSRQGEVWAVLGRNGLGKSTLLDTLTGTLKPLAGSVENQGGIGIVPQHSRLPFPYTVNDVVLMGRAQHVGPGSPGHIARLRSTGAAQYCTSRRVCVYIAFRWATTTGDDRPRAGDGQPDVTVG